MPGIDQKPQFAAKANGGGRVPALLNIRQAYHQDRF
jgi:hypothetical protein